MKIKCRRKALVQVLLNFVISALKKHLNGFIFSPHPLNPYPLYPFRFSGILFWPEKAGELRWARSPLLPCAKICRPSLPSLLFADEELVDRVCDTQHRQPPPPPGRNCSRRARCDPSRMSTKIPPFRCLGGAPPPFLQEAHLRPGSGGGRTAGSLRCPTLKKNSQCICPQRNAVPGRWHLFPKMDVRCQPRGAAPLPGLPRPRPRPRPSALGIIPSCGFPRRCSMCALR